MNQRTEQEWNALVAELEFQRNWALTRATNLQAAVAVLAARVEELTRDQAKPAQ